MLSGHAAIGAAFDAIFAGPLQMTGRALSIASAGTVALIRMHWQLVGSDGNVPLADVSAEVLARGADGLWRYIIDDPRGCLQRFKLNREAGLLVAAAILAGRF